MSLDQPAGFVKHPRATSDRFLGGRLVAAQPERGFRAGTDSVLLGAAVAPGSTSILDLGAGAGVAALVALAADPARSATLLERDPEMLALAAANIAANGFAARATAVAGDVAEAAALVPRHAFSSVIANPPYFDARRGTAASARGQGARHMPAGALELWARAAAGAVAAHGEVIVVLPATALAEALAALGPRFGALAVLPLAPRPETPASRILVRGIAGSRAPLTLLATRALHGAEGRAFAPDFEAIFRGEAGLVW